MMAVSGPASHRGGEHRLHALGNADFVADPGASCDAPPPPLCDCTFLLFSDADGVGAPSSGSVGRVPSLSTGGDVRATSYRAELTGPIAGAVGTEFLGSRVGLRLPSSGGLGPSSPSASWDGPATVQGPDGRYFLDFRGIGTGDARTSLRFGTVSVTTDTGGRIYVVSDADIIATYGLPATGAMCGEDITGSQPTCTNDLFLDFAKPVDALTLEAFSVGPLDGGTAQIFAGHSLLASFDITTAGLIDFGDYTGITRLALLDNGSSRTSGNKGIIYGNVNFAFVPLPPSGTALVVALLAFCLLRKRTTCPQ